MRISVSTVIEREWQKPLYFVYGQDDGKEQQVLDEKWITGFCRGDLCKTGTTYPLELFNGKRGTGLSGLHNRRMGRDEGSACTIRISPLVYHAAKPEKQSCSQSFEKKCAVYQHFPVETYLAEQLFLF